MTTQKPLSLSLRLAPFAATFLFAACDFDQLHNPDLDGGTGPTTAATGGAPTTSGAAGSTTAGSGGASSGSGGASGASSTAGPTGTGGGGAAGAGTTAAGGGGAGGSGGSMTSDASAGGSGGSGSADAGSEGAPCTAGYALQFNGTSAYATVARSIQDDFTLEAWIKPNASLPVLTGANIWNGYGILYADTTGTSNDFGTSIVNGKFAFGVGNPDMNVQSMGSIANGQWTHVAATRNMATGDIQVFINGTMDGTLAATQKSSLTAPALITIGADTIDRHYFGGLIDEVRLWSVVRSQTDIAMTMNRRLTGSEPGLVGYYRFDEGTGTTAQDTTPNNRNATLTGADAGAGPVWVMSDAPICQ